MPSLKRFEGMDWGIDSQCFIRCECGEELSVSDWKMRLCPKCGRQYQTEFIIWEYEPNFPKEE